MKLFKTPRFFRWIFPNKTWGFSRLENAVYLTFDDGPDSIITPWILDLLKEKNIQATFFCVGANAKKNPELVDRILSEGHSMGNHSMRHEKGVKTANRVFFESVKESQQFIDSPLFRPPYGRLKITQTWKLKKEYQIIMWSWLSYDFDHSIPLETILSKAQKQIKAGDILVLHDNPKCADRVKLLLPQLIDLISDKKLLFKVIEQKA
jgi:peptidoglycan/xylan/chitin deacetylase (PgdA/CDA1 family)